MDNSPYIVPVCATLIGPSLPWIVFSGWRKQEFVWEEDDGTTWRERRDRHPLRFWSNMIGLPCVSAGLLWYGIGSILALAR